MRWTFLLFSLLCLAAAWQERCYAAAAPFPRFTFHVRKTSRPAEISSSPTTAATQELATETTQELATEARGGAVHAVKTMTARQMEAFK